MYVRNALSKAGLTEVEPGLSGKLGYFARFLAFLFALFTWGVGGVQHPAQYFVGAGLARLSLLLLCVHSVTMLCDTGGKRNHGPLFT